MELNYDWRQFQSFFHSKRRVAALSAVAGSGSVFLVVENEVVITAYADGEDLRDWTGARLQDLEAEMSQRERVVLSRQEMDGLILGAVQAAHFQESLDVLRQGRSAQHFLLEALEGWWGNVLPSSYGVLLRLEGQTPRDLFVLFRKGKIDLFHEPDLSSLGMGRDRNLTEVVRFLSERHLVPVQGVGVAASEWDEWSFSTQPWRAVAQAIRSNRLKLVPFRWNVATLVGTRGFLGI